MAERPPEERFDGAIGVYDEQGQPHWWAPGTTLPTSEEDRQAMQTACAAFVLASKPHDAVLQDVTIAALRLIWQAAWDAALTYERRRATAGHEEG